MTVSARLAWLLSAALVQGCARRNATPRSHEETSSSTSLSALSVQSSASAARGPAPSTTTGAAESAPVALRSADGGATRCRVVRGPILLPVRGGVALAVRSEIVLAFANDNGVPRVVSWPVDPLPAPGAPPPPPESQGTFTSGSSLPCAVAGSHVFCSDRQGSVHRALISGDDDRVVAAARAGSRIGAGVLGSRPTLAYLASRETSEGWVSEAWIEVGDDPPVRLSEDGSGATAVAFAERGPGLVALLVDARAALTALHARPVAYGGTLQLGEDAVVFVGGPGDRHTAAALALPPAGPGWGILPIAKDGADFGMAIVRLDDPARVDEPSLWSMYPNGLDPAPVAAVVDRGRTWVARIRPETAAPAASRVLELGEVTASGSFEPFAVIGTNSAPKDVAIVGDPRGALWVAWVEASGSWAERLLCR